MKPILFFTLLFCLVESCQSSLPIGDITTIDNIPLGMNINSYLQSLDSLNIKHHRFVTKTTFTDFEQSLDDNNYVNMYYTDLFNFSNYQTATNKNLGLYYFLVNAGMQNISSIIILLGHTTDPLVMSSDPVLNNAVKGNLFVQDVNVNLIDDIKNLYVKKYGQPSDSFSMISHKIYAIQNNQIITNGDSRRGLQYTWNTKYYTIEFFTGYPSYNSFYTTDGKGYAEIFPLIGEISKTPHIADPKENEIQCNSFAYISYSLTQVALDKLHFKTGL